MKLNENSIYIEFFERNGVDPMNFTLSRLGTLYIDCKNLKLKVPELDKSIALSTVVILPYIKRGLVDFRKLNKEFFTEDRIIPDIIIHHMFNDELIHHFVEDDIISTLGEDLIKITNVLIGTFYNYIKYTINVRVSLVYVLIEQSDDIIIDFKYFEEWNQMYPDFRYYGESISLDDDESIIKHPKLRIDEININHYDIIDGLVILDKDCIIYPYKYKDIAGDYSHIIISKYRSYTKRAIVSDFEALDKILRCDSLYLSLFSDVHVKPYSKAHVDIYFMNYYNDLTEKYYVKDLIILANIRLNGKRFKSLYFNEYYQTEYCDDIIRMYPTDGSHIVKGFVIV